MLTVKQATFVAEYLIDLNATQASRRAGYSVRTINKQGPRLLKNPEIRAAIDSALMERSRRTGIKSEDVLMEITRIALHRITVGLGRAYDAKINMRSKQKALDQLARHLGPYGDQVQKLCLDYLIASLGVAKIPEGQVAQAAPVEPSAETTAAAEGDGCDWKYTAILPEEPQFAAHDYDPLSENSFEDYQILPI